MTFPTAKGAARALSTAVRLWAALIFAAGMWSGTVSARDGSAGNVAAVEVMSAARDAGPAWDGGRDAGSHAPESVPTDDGIEASTPALESERAWDEAPVVAPLPDIEPDPSLAPIIDGSGSVNAERRTVAPSERPGVVIKTILGLLALMVLAYLGGHPRVLRLEERLGISQVITTGFPFVILGLIARAPSVGILSDAILAELSPLLRLGLGWIGFVVGFRFDTRMFQGLPQSTLRVVTLTTALPFILVVGACAPLMLALQSAPLDLRDPVFLRDALTLGTCGTMTALVSARSSSNGSPGALAKVVRLEELAGIIGLAFVAAFFRPQGANVTWQIPGTAWVLLTIGLGVITGLIIYAILYRSSEGVDFLVLTLGSISFSAGAAGYLLLSSVVVAFIAGVLLANFTGTYHARLRAMLDGLERPIYLVSLVIVGALWDVGDWRGWLLMPAFMATRLLGKWIGTYLSLRDDALRLGPEERRALELPALGPLAIAIVINAQLLYPGGSISLIVSAVIGGGVLTEIFIQLSNRRHKRKGSDPAPAHAEEVRQESADDGVDAAGYPTATTVAVDTARPGGSEP